MWPHKKDLCPPNSVFKNKLRNFLSSGKPKLEYDGRFRVPQQLKAGMSLVIPVDFTGNPTPSATWSLRGSPLAHSSKYQIDTSEYNTTLTVRDTEMDDSGTYTVNVSNRAGSASASFDVNFKGTFLNTKYYQ